jgi:hypothetical protein
MTRKKMRAEVDDETVDEIVAILTAKELRPAALTSEERADAAYAAALDMAKLRGYTTDWAEELARRVRKRILWAKSSN